LEKNFFIFFNREGSNFEIVFGQCSFVNETWVQIIEKAYAKIHNNYQSLISGDIAQGLADLTGGVADKAKIEL
jgi:calpain, invertebrate